MVRALGDLAVSRYGSPWPSSLKQVSGRLSVGMFLVDPLSMETLTELYFGGEQKVLISNDACKYVFRCQWDDSMRRQKGIEYEA